MIKQCQNFINFWSLIILLEVAVFFINGYRTPQFCDILSLNKLIKVNLNLILVHVHFMSVKHHSVNRSKHQLLICKSWAPNKLGILSCKRYMYFWMHFMERNYTLWNIEIEIIIWICFTLINAEMPKALLPPKDIRFCLDQCRFYSLISGCTGSHC